VKITDPTKATEAVKRSYDRFAHLYDFIAKRSGRFRVWRQMVWSKIEGVRILEVGVGTGGNFAYYPAVLEVTGFDVSEKMLSRAKQMAKGTAVEGRLSLMDAQNLGFTDNSFDTVVASLVFCTVPDPVKGLKEIARVTRPGGKVVLLEHVLSSNLYLALLMRAVNPFTRAIFGENFNRKTVENVAKSGLLIERVTDVGWGIFKLIEARKS
jgi:phosphatidylethanolamine/phosphatidyl-N-methylethanolamine N-methyltransferase